MAKERDGAWLRAYVRHNQKAILRDVSVALLWTASIAFMVDQFQWPLWSFFVIYFGIWYVYLHAVPAWEDPSSEEPTDS